MANNIIYPTFKRALLGGTGGPIDFDADPLYCMLVDTTYDALSDAAKRAHDFINDVQANEITGTGYTAGGLLLSGGTIASDGADGYKITFTNPAWATATINAYGCVFYKRVGADLTTPADDPVCLFFSFNGVVSSTAGTFTITIPGTGLFLLP